MGLRRIKSAGSVLVMLAASWACSAEGGCSARTEVTTLEEESREGEPSLPGVKRPDLALEKRLAAAVREQGPDYEPRTHHLKADGTAQYTNRLILETSPYLLQHAHNPVNWHAWGERAFETAKRLNRPILLSVGYSTCHWCHVMEAESFEDEAIARVINENFVAIKVDREERPDIDDVYMKAVRFLAGRGGWPMTIVMTPDKDPFFAGTYFPARDGERGASKGFLSILRELNQQYRQDPTELIAKAQQTSQKIAASAMPARPGPVPGAEVLDAAARAYRGQLDPVYGGFGRAPKFPRPASLDFLFRYQHRAGLAGSEDHGARHAGLLTLRNMAAGGIFDHVGGGFHRYSTDRQWLVPHFEKMLYDNAQLVGSLLDAYQITGEERFAQVATRTLDYALREMLSPEGVFYSASDADSLGPGGHLEEGYFFTWTGQEVEKVLAPSSLEVFKSAFPMTESGNFEGRNILARSPLEYFGAQDERRQTLLASAFERLYAERNQRAKPLVDTKVLTSWNGLMIGAFARAGQVLARQDYIDQAERSAVHLYEQAGMVGGGLMRSSQGRVSKQPGFLEDHAFFMSGLIELSLATGNSKYMKIAEDLEAHLYEHFFDERDGGYFKTGKEYEELLAREKPSYDGAEPSGNSVATDNLLRLARVTGRGIYLKRAERNLGAFAEVLRGGTSAPRLLAALGSYLSTPVQVVVVQSEAAGRFENALAREVRSRYLPGAVVLMLSDEQANDLAESWPFLEAKKSRQGKPTAYVCERGSCELPTQDVSTLRAQLKSHALEPQAFSMPE